LSASDQLSAKHPSIAIKIIYPENQHPEYKTKLSSGADIRAVLKEDLVLKPLERSLIPTGIYVEIPVGYEIQIRPRSGLAIKHGISMVNTPGTVDADYRGEIKVILVNLSNESYTIKNGERIAQMVLAPIVQAEWIQDDNHSSTNRGSGGFGSTGKQ
jgi:dUTP pyrophosphatase